MATPKYKTNRILLGIGGLFVLACILVFAAGMLAPRSLAFLDGVMCPDGMQLNNQTQQEHDSECNLVDATTLVCEGSGEPVDATARMLMVEFGLAALAAVFMVASVGGVQRVS